MKGLLVQVRREHERRFVSCFREFLAWDKCPGQPCRKDNAGRYGKWKLPRKQSLEMKRLDNKLSNENYDRLCGVIDGNIATYEARLMH